MNVDSIYGGQFLSAATAKSDKLVNKPLTIKAARLETLREREKIVLTLEETEREIVLSKRNAMSLAQAYGPETEAWTGKKFMLVVVPTQYQGQTVDGLQIIVAQ